MFLITPVADALPIHVKLLFKSSDFFC